METADRAGARRDLATPFFLSLNSVASAVKVTAAMEQRVPVICYTAYLVVLTALAS
ncbi:hypothetical protein AB0G35_24865 [Streptomyces sp. NPDC021749]|uniref:hypothetical protein n=1 Tax=Streptomyces sp. NPDC021749 TaxID=3154905 RepID=UPI0033DFA9D0